MRSLRLSAKLALAVTIVMGAAALTAGTALWGLRDTNRRLASVHADRVVPLEQLGDIRHFLAGAARAAAQEGGAVPSDTVARAFATIDTIWGRYMQTYLTPEERELAAASAARLREARTALEDPGVALPPGRRAADETVGTATEALTRLIALQVRVADAEVAATTDFVERTSTAVVIGGLLTLALVGAVGWWFAQDVVRALKIVGVRLSFLRANCVADLRRAMQALAAGDFTIEVQPRTTPLTFQRGDEIGQMADEFDRTLADVQAIVIDYQRARQTLHDVVHRVDDLGTALGAGRLDARIDPATLGGDFLAMARGMNDALATVVAPMERAGRELGTLLPRLAEGDLDRKSVV